MEVETILVDISNSIIKIIKEIDKSIECNEFGYIKEDISLSQIIRKCIMGNYIDSKLMKGEFLFKKEYEHHDMIKTESLVIEIDNIIWGHDTDYSDILSEIRHQTDNVLHITKKPLLFKYIDNDDLKEEFYCLRDINFIAHNLIYHHTGLENILMYIKNKF